jgi:RNA polymerase sigma-70 factor, ECF subfamily
MEHIRSLRLFLALPRIPTDMTFLRPNTTFRVPAGKFLSLAAGRPSLAASSALCFSSFMLDDSQSLARALKRRDPDLLDRLIEQYQFRLFRYLLHLTGNRQSAEDFFQETWLRVLERGHQYDGKWKFEAWLFAIARNLVLDWHRRKKPQSLDSLGGPDEDSTFDVADEKSDSPLDQVLHAETSQGIQLSLEKVPAVYREVLVLRFQEEMQLDEIAGVTGAPISTVKSRLYRGLEALKGIVRPPSEAGTVGKWT